MTWAAISAILRPAGSSVIPVVPDTIPLGSPIESTSTTTTIKGFQAKNPGLTVTVDRADLNRVMMGQTSCDDLIGAGKAKFEDNRAGFDRLRSILVPFTPDFEIMPGTAPK